MGGAGINGVGADGVDGMDGMDGMDGTDGADGVQVLMRLPSMLKQNPLKTPSGLEGPGAAGPFDG